MRQTERRNGFSRRSVLRGAVAVAGLTVCSCAHMKDNTVAENSVTFGVLADPQYADIEPSIGRYYRDAAEKVRECIDVMNRERPAFVIEMGDLIDNNGGPDLDREALKRIDGIYRQFQGPRYYVLGNHDLVSMSKRQFMRAVGMPAEHYAFDCGPIRCIVLDANFTKDMISYSVNNFTWTDCWIPPEQREWLAGELKRMDRKAVIFVHQPLDDENGSHGVGNGAEVRKVLEASGKVIAVFQGHNHKGAMRRINGIPYFTMRGMVDGKGLENNGYAIVRVSGAGEVEVRGYGRQASYPGTR